MKKNFEGYYFKHVCGETFLALIAGRSRKDAFVQIVTRERAYYVSYPRDAYFADGIVRVGANFFSQEGAVLNINTDEVTLNGTLRYGALTPLESDIMGPFRFLPMQCRHRVVSMGHRVDGTAALNGDLLHFDGGTGYIEGDEGRAFPAGYLWMQCSDFGGPSSVMVSIADIPFAGFRFTGCIAVVYHGGKEYRLATYGGVRIESRSATRIALRQGNLRLTAELESADGHALRAPARGGMGRTIVESPCCPVSIRFEVDGKIVLAARGVCASFEYAYEDAAELASERGRSETVLPKIS